VRAQNCVKSTRVATIGELCDLTEDEFLAARGFGETSLRETRARLAELGLRFRDPAEPPRYDRWVPGRANELELGDKAHWSLAALELSARACTALEAGGVVEVGSLVARSAEELLELPGVDAVVVAEVSARLASHGLHLGMRRPPA
jgi:DNA-directed RNA polymerase subunit alpha